MNAAIAAVLVELDNIFSLQKEQRMALKAFLEGKDVFALLLTGFGKSHECNRQDNCLITHQLFFLKRPAPSACCLWAVSRWTCEIYTLEM